MNSGSLPERDIFLDRFRTTVARLQQEYDEVDGMMKQLAVAMEDARQDELFIKWKLTGERFARLFEQVIPTKSDTI